MPRFLPGGYDNNPLSGANLNYGFGLNIATETVYVPPSLPIAGVPGVAATPTRVKLKKNKGWNTTARSILPLEKGKFFDFNCNSGIEGCCVGISHKNNTNINIRQFSHSVISDVSGIKVYELGEVVATLKNTQTSLSNIRIYLGQDKLIRYVVTTDTESILYTSTEPLAVIVPYIYGFLYSAGDLILSAEYKTGVVEYGSV